VRLWKDGLVTHVRSLRTFVELDERNATANSVRARLDAVLDDGALVTLLNDRGWSGGRRMEDCTVAEIEHTARTVVGPDEPLASRGETAVEMTERHREALQRTLSEAGVDGAELDFDALPHDVDLGPRLSEHLST
jgi:hypothetical protein